MATMQIAYAMLPLSAQLKDFWFRRLASIYKTRNSSASCNSQSPLYGGPRKVLNAFTRKTLWQSCCSIITGELTDGPLSKILRPGPQHWCTLYVATEYRHFRQDSLPVNVSCRRDSLSVTDSGSHSGTPFDELFVNFCVTKFRQNSGDISKKMTCPFPAGGPMHVRTVPNG